jgi:hypothetical protein
MMPLMTAAPQHIRGIPSSVTPRPHLSSLVRSLRDLGDDELDKATRVFTLLKKMPCGPPSGTAVEKKEPETLPTVKEEDDLVSDTVVGVRPVEVTSRKGQRHRQVTSTALAESPSSPRPSKRRVIQRERRAMPPMESPNTPPGGSQADFVSLSYLAMELQKFLAGDTDF